jgi:hypothetical protein
MAQSAPQWAANRSPQESHAGSQTMQAAPASPVTAASTTLEVKAFNDDVSPAGLAPVLSISGKQIVASAGTYGDLSRFLQVLPGVVWTSDLSNDVLVRGGHPEENLFVIDGVEFPGISHFSLSGSSGGFTSMIDSTAVGSMDLRSGAYDASRSSRLSSLIEIHTRPLGEATQQRLVTVGISGIGGLYQRALPGRGSILVSAHRSILNLFTDNIGIGGVPIYTNSFARFDFDPGSRDSLALLSLSGQDSIQLTPCASDPHSDSFMDTGYAGWRTTDALTWKHTFNASLIANLTATYSLTHETIRQEQQAGATGVDSLGSCTPLSTVPTYLENSRNELPQLNYTVRAGAHGWLFTAGASGGLIAPHNAVAQPIGQLSPFSRSIVSSDADNFQHTFSSGQSAGFLQAEGTLGTRWSLMAGLRAESFAIDGQSAVEPRISALYRLNAHQSLHASWNRSAQLPPTMDLISYPGNRSLPPIEVRQEAVGMRLWQAGWGTVDAEAYTKQYLREPVSTEYPQLMLFNMVDTLGQAFVWLPLTGKGSAQARGLELTFRSHWRSRVNLLLSATRSQSTYRALDGIRRPANYDTPVVINSMTSLRLPRGLTLTGRETFSSGRVYCPFDMADSYGQNRGIYDLSRINALRGPLYNRLDMELERRFPLHKGAVEVQAGAENVFNRGNLLGYVWMQGCSPLCGGPAGAPPIGKIDQMGRFPSFSARYEF